MSIKPSCILKLAGLLLFFPMSVQAELKKDLVSPSDKFQYPFYVGITGGYGTTTWNQLVSRNFTAAMVLSTPIGVEEGGAAWGLFAGYEFIPTFAVEASYLRYPSAKIVFSPMSIFAFDMGSTQFSSKTEMLALSGKFMVLVPYTTIRAYSSAGAAGIHRNDFVNNTWTPSAVFGVGFNYNLTPRVMLEIGADYATGSGQSELDPAEDYIPFTYAVFGRIAYRF